MDPALLPGVGLLLVAPSILAVPLATIRLSGVAWGLIAGGTIASGIWLAILVTVVSSGARISADGGRR
jgi:hypothetical protein